MKTLRMSIHLGDYASDTAHLTCLQHGIYFNLMRHYYKTGALPTDEKQLRRIAKVDGRTWQRNVALVRQLFDASWRHKRIEAELADYAERSKRKAENGKRGGLANAKKKSSSPSPSLSKERKKEERVSSGRETIIHTSESEKTSEILKYAPLKHRIVAGVADEFFETFWRACPKRGKASNPKQTAKKKFNRLVADGVRAQDLIDAASRWRAREQHLGTEPQYVAMVSTWLNQRRFDDAEQEAAPINGAKTNGQGNLEFTERTDQLADAIRQYGSVTAAFDASRLPRKDGSG